MKIYSLETSKKDTDNRELCKRIAETRRGRSNWTDEEHDRLIKTYFKVKCDLKLAHRQVPEKTLLQCRRRIYSFIHGDLRQKPTKDFIKLYKLQVN